MGDVIQVIGDGNLIITQLKDRLKVEKLDLDKAKKKKLVKYIDGTEILDMFSIFHGANKENELVSAIKSLYKGDKSALPVTMQSIKQLTCPQLKLFLRDFFSDIAINKDFGSMSKRRKKSHIKRFKYREMLRGKNG